MSKDEEVVEVQLYSSVDEYIINQICAILKEKEIPFIRNDDGSGSYMRLYMGESIQEKRIYVNKSDYDKALEAIYNIIPNVEDDKNISEEVEEEEDNNSIDKHKLARRVLGFLTIVLPITIALLVVTASLIPTLIRAVIF